MNRLLAFVLVLLSFSAPALAEQPVTSFKLNNGMQVVVIEDHRAPVVVHMVWYKVGAADEPRGKSGIAHFLEHLMFKGTDVMAAGELSKVVAANGGNDNAFTSWDYTGYYQRVAADRLELMMRMEADRMVNLKMTKSDAMTERDVILEERAQRTDSDPGALFGEQRRAAQYLNSPYGIPVIGWRREVSNLTRADALSFYKTFYAPNNAVLVVAGDVDPQEVKRLAQKYYGVLPANKNLPPRLRPQEPPQLAERRMTLSDARIAQPYVIRTYLAPERDPGNQDKAAALVILSELLGGSPATSVLGQKLQFEQKKAIYTSAFYSPLSTDATTFGLVIVPTQGVTLAEAEAALDSAIAQFEKDGIDEAQFERIKMQLRASRIYGEDNVQAQARKYGSALATGLSIADVKAWPERLQAVTQKDVLDAARSVFNKKRAVTGWLTNPATQEAVTQ